MRDKKGFTLVEIIVVVCILAVLAGIGVTSYVRYIQKAQAKACALTRTELAQDYADFIELFDADESLEEYVLAEIGSLGDICPAGGACSCGERDGKPYILCSKHAAED